MIRDQSADSALYLEAQYREAFARAPSPERSERLEKIVDAARAAGLYRLFVAALDCRVPPL